MVSMYTKVCLTIHQWLLPIWGYYEPSMGVHVSPTLNPLLTSLPIPSHPTGLSQCIGSECPVSCIEPRLVISHTVIHMCQCYSLKSSHPRLLPQNPEVCSLYLCLFCCLAYIVIVIIFLNSIYLC